MASGVEENLLGNLVEVTVLGGQTQRGVPGAVGDAQVFFGEKLLGDLVEVATNRGDVKGGVSIIVFANQVLLRQEL